MVGENKKIFIPLASCEERFLEQTIRSAIRSAKNPDNLYFGVFNNILKREHTLLDNEFFTQNHNIFYSEVVSPGPLGIGFARAIASTLQFADCDYMFQIDAHTLFTKDWDEKIVSVFNQIRDEANVDEEKIILTGIPQFTWSYNENDLNTILSPNEHNNGWITIDPYNLEATFSDKIEQGLTVPRFVFDGKQNNVYSEADVGFPIVYGGEQRIDQDYQEVNCVHASFVFSKANLNREVLHDPEDFFSGDQTNFSIRLLSRGYRIFCPKYPTISTLNKFLPKNNDWTHSSIDLDTEHNWRTFKEIYKNGTNYNAKKIKDDREFYNKIITGKYFGFWGAPDLESLEYAKNKMGLNDM